MDRKTATAIAAILDNAGYHTTLQVAFGEYAISITTADGDEVDYISISSPEHIDNMGKAAND